jgi:hypothetical protein
MYHAWPHYSNKSLMSRPISCSSYICTVTIYHHLTADVLWQRLCDFVKNKWQYNYYHFYPSYAKELAIKSNLGMLLVQFFMDCIMDFVNEEQRILCKLELCGLTIELFYMGQLESKIIWEFHVVEN